MFSEEVYTAEECSLAQYDGPQNDFWDVLMQQAYKSENLVIKKYRLLLFGQRQESSETLF